MEQKYKTTKGRKFLAFIIGYIGAGVLWVGLTSFATATKISSDSLLGIIGELVGVILVIIVWVKLYRYYVKKWAKVDVATKI
jgi:hypothetical protein